MSCSRTPETRPVTALKIFDGMRRVSGSRRFVFQPETRSYPSSSLARSRGISAGSSCRSPSIVTTSSPAASPKPASSAVALPKFRRRRTTRTLSCASWSRVSAPKVPSVEPSSTNTASHVAAVACERVRQLVVEQRDAALLVVDGDDDRDHAARVPRSAGVACGRGTPPHRRRGALASVLAQVEPLPTEHIPLRDAAGRILAEDVRRAVDLPPFPSSSMDGYAVRCGRSARACCGSWAMSPPGRPRAGSSRPGEAIEISTGGVVPDGADAVVPVEQVTVRTADGRDREGRCRRRQHPPARAATFAAGATSSARASLLTPARLGALAACGIETVCGLRGARRSRSPSPGRSFALPGEPLGAGEIYESNGDHVAAALARAPERVVERLGVAEDTEAAHALALERALAADVVVTSGGVSVGPHDLVRRVEARLGVKEVFWGVAMRPGKPLAFGVRERTLVFGLPGNPVSSLVGCLLFVVPGAARAAGRPSIPRPRSGPASSQPRFVAATGARRLRPSARRLGARTAPSSTRSSARSRT